MIPTRKVSVGAVAGAVSILLVLILRRFGIELTVEESQAVTLVLSFVAGYAMPEKPAEAGDTQAPAP